MYAYLFSFTNDLDHRSWLKACLESYGCSVHNIDETDIGLEGTMKPSEQQAVTSDRFRTPLNDARIDMEAGERVLIIIGYFGHGGLSSQEKAGTEKTE